MKLKLAGDSTFHKRKYPMAAAPKGGGARLRLEERVDPWDADNQQQMLRLEAAQVPDLYDKFQAMRDTERTEMERRNLVDNHNVRRTLDNAIEFVGSCQQMCPVYERVRRVHQNAVKEYELDGGQISSSRAIKAFSRPAAGQPPALPSDVRPPSVLQQTTRYLVDNILPLLPAAHPFLWDRTRSVRQDFTYQNFAGKEAVECTEQIVRIHIYCMHVMVGDPDWSKQQELEQFNKALKTLDEFYSLRVRRTLDQCPSEPEMRAYQLLSGFFDPEIAVKVEGLPAFVTGHPLVRLAFELRALRQVPGRLFARLRGEDVPELFKVLCRTHFARLRADVLNQLGRCLNRKSRVYPVQRFVQLLGLQQNELGPFCTQNKLKVSDGWIDLNGESNLVEAAQDETVDTTALFVQVSRAQGAYAAQGAQGAQPAAFKAPSFKVAPGAFKPAAFKPAAFKNAPAPAPLPQAQIAPIEDTSAQAQPSMPAAAHAQAHAQVQANQAEAEAAQKQRAAQEQEQEQEQVQVQVQARQEAARQEAARQEAARQEAARQEAARQEAARQELARQQREQMLQQQQAERERQQREQRERANSLFISLSQAILKSVCREQALSAAKMATEMAAKADAVRKHYAKCVLVGLQQRGHSAQERVRAQKSAQREVSDVELVLRKPSGRKLARRVLRRVEEPLAPSAQIKKVPKAEITVEPNMGPKEPTHTARPESACDVSTSHDDWSMWVDKSLPAVPFDASILTAPRDTSIMSTNTSLRPHFNHSHRLGTSFGASSADWSGISLGNRSQLPPIKHSRFSETLPPPKRVQRTAPPSVELEMSEPSSPDALDSFLRRSRTYFA